MAGYDFVILGTSEEALQAVRDAAQAEQFEITGEPDGGLAARKGNFALSILLGAFIAYCEFKFAAQPAGAGAVRLSMKRNSPWWTGLIGVSRVKKAALRFADLVEQSLGDRMQSRTEV